MSSKWCETTCAILNLEKCDCIVKRSDEGLYEVVVFYGERFYFLCKDVTEEIADNFMKGIRDRL